MEVDIVHVKDASLKSQYCREILPLLPDWFGMEAANEAYITDMANREVFAAFKEGELFGLAGLKNHMGVTLEIWWMGIKPPFHRQGIGKKLFEVMHAYARDEGYMYMAVNTLSDRSDDEFYARTRTFYQSLGFHPFLEENEDDPLNPMIWMILPLGCR